MIYITGMIWMSTYGSFWYKHFFMLIIYLYM